ncbi:hypothetical protein Shyhy01_17340 [Streptomyces hygroscopicus subsp. hygroscopicus]|nr:hypothetical protein Shyhy01_17340 [Streptomyces hygroscopicus subsp. hygroscopicus]
MRRRRRARLAAADLGRSRGGLTTKTHLSRVPQCRPLSLKITAGQAGDSPQFIPVLNKIRVPGPVGRPRTRPDAVAGDKAYSSARTVAGPCGVTVRGAVAAALGPAVGLVPAAVGDVAELLDVDVDQFAGPAAFVAADRLAGRPVQRAQYGQVVSDEDAVGGGGGDAAPGGQPQWADAALTPQVQHPGLDGSRGSSGLAVRAAGAVAHPGLATGLGQGCITVDHEGLSGWCRRRNPHRTGRPSPVQDPSAETWLTRPQPPRTEQLAAGEGSPEESGFDEFLQRFFGFEDGGAGEGGYVGRGQLGSGDEAEEAEHPGSLCGHLPVPRARRPRRVRAAGVPGGPRSSPGRTASRFPATRNVNGSPLHSTATCATTSCLGVPPFPPRIRRRSSTGLGCHLRDREEVHGLQSRQGPAAGDQYQAAARSGQQEADIARFVENSWHPPKSAGRARSPRSRAPPDESRYPCRS